MGACAKDHIALFFLTRNGRFLARVVGESKGNVVLRKTQYRISEDENMSGEVARNFILGKIYNNKWIIERATRDYPLRVDVQKFNGRSRRPPLDNVNALLSFAYTLLANDTAAALECVGLDAYVGFLHRDRPGRVSLALDLMEELRGVYADRFVISLINKRIIQKEDFNNKPSGAVLLTDDGRKTFLKHWQEKKQEKIVHPYLGEKIPWGLVPFAQAMLLARFLRKDLQEYPPFLWK